MGIAVSKDQCKLDYGIDINCDIIGTDPTSNATIPPPPYTSLGGFTHGEISGDPDVGGIVILGTFLAVTCFSIFVALLYLIWTLLKATGLKPTWSENDKYEKHKGTVVSFSGILEAIILCSSDQQFFTGAAYGVALRYWRRCVVSAYHYNLISSMLLLSCATHILAVAVVRHYFRHKTLAILRICCVACFLAMTATFMINTNAKTDLRFPTIVPTGPDDSLMFLPAACFQTIDSLVKETVTASTANATALFENTIWESAPDYQKLQGWRWFVCFVLYYGFTLIPSSIRLFRLMAKKITKTDPVLKIPQGARGKWGQRLEKLYGRQTRSRRLFQYLYCGYLAIGIAFAIGCAYNTADFIFGLRKWAHGSGWMEQPIQENDKTTFGQLVTALSCSYIAFGVLQVISDRRTQAEDGRKLRNSTLKLAHVRMQSGMDIISPQEKQGSVFSGSYDAAGGKTRTSYFPLQAVTPGVESTMPLTATPKWPASRMSSYNIDPFIPSPGLGLGSPQVGGKASSQPGSVHNSPQAGHRTSSHAGSSGSAQGARPASVVQEGSTIGLAAFHSLSSGSIPNLEGQTTTIVSVPSESGPQGRKSNESDKTVKNGCSSGSFESPGPIGSPPQSTGLGFSWGGSSSYTAVPNPAMTPEAMSPADDKKPGGSR